MSSALPACCLEAAGGGPCIPLASRNLKDRSKPWQGTARANSYVFHGGKYRTLPGNAGHYKKTHLDDQIRLDAEKCMDSNGGS